MEPTSPLPYLQVVSTGVCDKFEIVALCALEPAVRKGGKVVVHHANAPPHSHSIASLVRLRVFSCTFAAQGDGRAVRAAAVAVCKG